MFVDSDFHFLLRGALSDQEAEYCLFQSQHWGNVFLVVHDAACAGTPSAAPRFMINAGAVHPRWYPVISASGGDVLAAVPWLLIPYDSLTHLVGLDLGSTSQTFPVTAVLCIGYLLLRGRRLLFCESSRDVCVAMGRACTIIVVVTLINIALEQASVVRADAPLMRMDTAVRQGVSLALGFGSLLMFQDSVLRLGFTQCMRWTVIGVIPSLVLATIQMIVAVDRVQGFSSEPSQFADMLVFAFFPACALASVSWRLRLASALVGAFAFLRTFSTTGFLKALFAIVAYFAARRQLAKGFAFLAVLLGLGWLVMSRFPENYALLVLSFMRDRYEETGNLVTGSFIDRFYGFVGPISLFGHPHAWLGFGLGGDTVYFDSLFSADIASDIRDVKGNIAAISSLQGKMLMYGGVFGYGMYILAWLRAWRSSPQQHPARVMLPAVWIASLFSVGPIFLPYTWLWLAAASTATQFSDLKMREA